MRIQRNEINFIPNTTEGRKFADEYEKRLKAQGAFRDRKEGTVNITIEAIYFFDLKDESEEQA